MRLLISFRALLAAALLAASLLVPAISAQPACVAATSQQLIVYHAGSLSAAFTPVEQAFTCQTGVQVQDMTGGSVDLLRQITAGGKPADIVASADYVDIDNFLKPGELRPPVRPRPHGAGLQRQRRRRQEPGHRRPGRDVQPTRLNSHRGRHLVSGRAPAWRDGRRLAPFPLLDPSGYRSHLMFQLTQNHYNVPNLYNNLLEHYLALPAAAPSNAFTLGKQYDFSLTYEHSAMGAAGSNPDYRYAYLPDDIDLSNPAKNDLYKQAVVKMPGLGVPDSDASIDVQGSRVAWGLTVMKSAPNRENAIKFLQLLLAPGDVGQTTLQRSAQPRSARPWSAPTTSTRCRPSCAPSSPLVTHQALEL
jgi:molybdate/tungstate transport system substrate-binding protein